MRLLGAVVLLISNFNCAVHFIAGAAGHRSSHSRRSSRMSAVDAMGSGARRASRVSDTITAAVEPLKVAPVYIPAQALTKRARWSAFLERDASLTLFDSPNVRPILCVRFLSANDAPFSLAL